MVENLKNGQRVEFVYHGKPRTGTVDTIRQTCVVVKLDTPEDGTEFKGFKFSKIEHLKIN